MVILKSNWQCRAKLIAEIEWTRSIQRLTPTCTTYLRTINIPPVVRTGDARMYHTDRSVFACPSEVQSDDPLYARRALQTLFLRNARVSSNSTQEEERFLLHRPSSQFDDRVAGTETRVAWQNQLRVSPRNARLRRLPPSSSCRGICERGPTYL